MDYKTLKPSINTGFEGFFQWGRQSLTSGKDWQTVDLSIAFTTHALFLSATPRSRFYNTVIDFRGLNAMGVTLFDTNNTDSISTGFISIMIYALGY